MTKRNFWKRKPPWQTLQKRRPPNANQGKAMEKERVLERRTGKGKMLKERRNRMKNGKKGPRSKKRRSRKSWRDRKRRRKGKLWPRGTNCTWRSCSKSQMGRFGVEKMPTELVVSRMKTDLCRHPMIVTQILLQVIWSSKPLTWWLWPLRPPDQQLGGKGPGSNGRKSSQLIYLLPQRLAWDARSWKKRSSLSSNNWKLRQKKVSHGFTTEYCATFTVFCVFNCKIAA